MWGAFAIGLIADTSLRLHREVSLLIPHLHLDYFLLGRGVVCCCAFGLCSQHGHSSPV